MKNEEMAIIALLEFLGLQVQCKARTGQITKLMIEGCWCKVMQSGANSGHLEPATLSLQVFLATTPKAGVALHQYMVKNIY